MMKVYVTKYALTIGIYEREVEEPDDSYGLCREVGVQYPGYFRLGKECFSGRSEAVADAEKRRKSKISSVKKQLAKLEAMTF